MTYCVALSVERGLVFASDSRTNAGPDQVSVFGKMHVLLESADRFFVLLSAGNLGTTQAVRTRIRHDLEFDRHPNLRTVQSMAEAAEYLGGINAEQRRKHTEGGEADAAMTATFILGGQIKGQAPELYMIYPEGNHITASDLYPYLQIGETKYGKPILDRIIRPDTPVETAMRCALVSIDSTMRSNATVGPPLECLFYRRDSLMPHEQYCLLEEDHWYLADLRKSWDDNIRLAFDNLPPISAVFEDAQ